MNWIKRLFAKESSPSKNSPISGPKAEAKSAGSRAEIESRFSGLRQPALHLRPDASSSFSRLGGLPRMPESLEWPTWNGVSQSFLAQIDLADLQRTLPSCLPVTGFLYFFYDFEQSAWGFDPKDLGTWRVLYHPGSLTNVRERSAPSDLPPEGIYPPKPVCPQRIELLPDLERLPSRLEWQSEGQAYDALRREAFDGMTCHQMLGFPTPIQNDTMELECQLASNGVYVGSPEGYRDPRVADLRSGASEWKLLLQLDSDNDTGWMWGDVGTIYFWIKESDASQADFSKVWMIFQCH